MKLGKTKGKTASVKKVKRQHDARLALIDPDHPIDPKPGPELLAKPLK
jgi:hypothetical protein